jgi:hypothetical protein
MQHRRPAPNCATTPEQRAIALTIAVQPRARAELQQQAATSAMKQHVHRQDVEQRRVVDQQEARRAALRSGCAR